MAKPEQKGPTRTAPGTRSRPPARARSTWLYGLHTVLAAVANRERRCHRLIAVAEAADRLTEAAAGAGAPPPAVETLPRGELAALLPAGAVHQGVAALVEPLAQPSLADLLGRLSGASITVVVLDQATDPRNVGALLRAAAAFGAAAVVVQDRHAPEVTPALAKAASGAVEIVPLVPVVNVARALRDLKAEGFWCVGLDPAARDTLAAAGLAGRVALVVGSEGAGLRRLVAASCDALVRIPIAAAVDSLNVAIAAAIALYELARGRR